MITIAGGMEIDATLHAHIAGKKRVIIAKSGTNQAIAKFDKASSFAEKIALASGGQFTAAQIREVSKPKAA